MPAGLILDEARLAALALAALSFLPGEAGEAATVASTSVFACIGIGVLSVVESLSSSFVGVDLDDEDDGFLGCIAGCLSIIFGEGVGTR